MASPEITVPSLDILVEDRPPGLPSPIEVMRLCKIAGYRKNGIPFPSPDCPIAWIKYGFSIGMGEARTQHKIAQTVNTLPDTAVRIPKVYIAFVHNNIGYIVMEYIVGRTVQQLSEHPGTVRKSSLKAVAAAVQQLIEIRAPAGTQPGPVGGGLIRHIFFEEQESTVAYPTVDDLEAHINNILELQGLPVRVDLVHEVTEGLPLCHSDIHETNFIINDQGHVFAIDFGHICFLPPSFVAYALNSWRGFTRLVAARMNFPEPKENIFAMEMAAGQLVVHGSSAYGLPPDLRKVFLDSKSKQDSSWL